MQHNCEISCNAIEHYLVIDPVGKGSLFDVITGILILFPEIDSVLISSRFIIKLNRGIQIY